MWGIPKPSGIERFEDSPSGWDTFLSLLDKHGRHNKGRNTAKTIAECIIDVHEKYWREIDMFCLPQSIGERKASEQYIGELRAAVSTWGCL